MNDAEFLNCSKNIARITSDKLVHAGVRFTVSYPEWEEHANEVVLISVHPDDLERAKETAEIKLPKSMLSGASGRIPDPPAATESGVVFVHRYSGPGVPQNKLQDKLQEVYPGENTNPNRVVRLQGSSVLEWFQHTCHAVRNLDTAAIDEWINSHLGGHVSGFDMLLDHWANSTDYPATWHELRDTLRNRLYIEGPGPHFWNDRYVYVKTDDDEFDVHYYFFDARLVTDFPDRIGGMMTQSWNPLEGVIGIDLDTPEQAATRRETGTKL